MSRATRTPTTDDAAAAESLAEPSEERTASVRRRGYSLPGLVGALVFLCLSLSPSLLPRTGLIQGLVCGITAAFGYGIGVLAAWMWRAFADREARPARRRSWQILAVVAAVASSRRWSSAATGRGGSGRCWRCRRTDSHHCSSRPSSPRSSSSS